MSNAVAIAQSSALTMQEGELIGVLKNSLYPGATDGSIKLVLGYCKAAGLDPMQKPVHIVPMSVSTGKKNDKGWDIKEMRDVVMPGIGLYRTQAARSGQYAGVTEPDFGPDVTESLGGVNITFPAWCRITVKRLLGDQIIEFSAKEFWKENYASAGRDKPEPNAMWRKRPYAQLAKCCEAQALRKAFPEFGSAPTADEMEGKPIDEVEINSQPNRTESVKQEPAQEFYADDQFQKNLPAWTKLIQSGKKNAGQIIATVSAKAKLTDSQMEILRAIKIDAQDAELMATPEQMKTVRRLAEDAGITWAEVSKFLGIGEEEILTERMVQVAIQFIADPAAA